ncbi:MAG: Glutathione-regulated potassium-efflux system protein KefC [Planctomycetota bacterium]|jgi:CPA2 family monovalent cation:H+ antiporter-2
MDTWDLLLQIVLLLLACFAAGGVMVMLRQSPLVGFLLAGLLVGGPGSFAIVKAESEIEGLAELGVALLLFSLGLEFSWQRVLGLGTRTLIAGVLQVLVTMAVFTLLGRSLGLGFAGSIACSAMITLSSTATAVGVLADRSLLDSPMGRNSIAVLLVQDMAVVPLAVLIPLLGNSSGSGAMLPRILGIILAGGGVVVALYLLLNLLAVRVMKMRSIGQNRELMVLLSVIVGLGATWSAHAAGLSPALGAFVAGMYLGNSPFALQIRADVASLKIVLLTLFFGTVGLLADPLWMFQNLTTVLALALMILTVKVLVVAVLFRTSGAPSGTSLATGLCLGSVGEFAFVLGGQAIEVGLLTESHFNAIVSASIVSLILTPTLITVAPGLAAWLNGRVNEPLDGNSRQQLAKQQCDCLIIGYGPAGRGAGTALTHCAEKVMVIDLGAEGVRSAHAAGFHAMQADASSGEVLQHLHLERLRLVVITVPGFHDSMAMLQQIRRMAPNATVIVRSRYSLHQPEFLAAGADVVAGDEAEVGQALAAAISRQRTLHPA